MPRALRWSFGVGAYGVTSRPPKRGPPSVDHCPLKGAHMARGLAPILRMALGKSQSRPDETKATLTRPRQGKVLGVNHPATLHGRGVSASLSSRKVLTWREG